MTQPSIHLSSIIVGSFFLFLLMLGVYYIAEHLALVPWIGLYDPPKDFAISEFDFTRYELLINFVLLVEFVWVAGWTIIFKYLFKFKVIW